MRTIPRITPVTSSGSTSAQTIVWEQRSEPLPSEVRLDLSTYITHFFEAEFASHVETPVLKSFHGIAFHKSQSGVLYWGGARTC